jgi:hypothetical protein
MGKYGIFIRLNCYCPLNVANSILDVHLFDEIEEDKLVWQYDIHGIYNVKSAYNLLNPTVEVARTENIDWKWIWKVYALPKAKHLI